LCQQYFASRRRVYISEIGDFSIEVLKREIDVEPACVGSEECRSCFVVGGGACWIDIVFCCKGRHGNELEERIERGTLPVMFLDFCGVTVLSLSVSMWRIAWMQERFGMRDACMHDMPLLTKPGTLGMPLQMSAQR